MSASPDRPLPLLDQVLERSPIGIAVIDFEGCYHSVNPAYCHLYGWRSDELIGRSFTVVFPPTQREAALARHRRFLVQGVDFKGEREVVRRDGSPRWVIAESLRLPGPDGRDLRLVYVIDITERKRTELALAASGRFLQSVIDAMHAHICVLDERGVILMVNRAWRDFAHAGGAPASQIGEGCSYLAASRGQPPMPHSVVPRGDEFAARLGEVLAGRRSAFTHEYACDAAGEQRWFIARVARIVERRPVSVVVAHDDITALKRSQETLRANESLLRDLASSIPAGLIRCTMGAHHPVRVDYVSPGMQALFELPLEQLRSDPRLIRRRVEAPDRPDYDASIAAALRQHVLWDHEFRVRTPDGATKWIHARATPKIDESGDTVWTGVLTDIGERKHFEAALERSEATYRTLFETVPQGIVALDPEGRVTSANPAAQRILGLSLAQMRARRVFGPDWPALREDGSALSAAEQPTAIVLTTGLPVRGVVMAVSVPGPAQAWISVSAIPLYEDGRIASVYASFEDITAQVQLRRELREQAATDFLTGAANRRAFVARLTLEFERVQRHPELDCCLVSIDIDRFKAINDSAGHAAGDAVLCHLTRLMRESTRQVDLVGRVGGEEFALLLPDTSVGEALGLAERLRLRLAQSPAAFEDRTIAFTVSIGVSAVRASDAGIDAVLARADRALYEAKGAGRDQVRLAPPAD